MSKLSTLLDAHCMSLSACRACNHAPGIVPILSASRAPRAMLVGQAPGKVEAVGGRAFAGRAGKTLFRWLERAGVDEITARERIYIAAVTRCFPGPNRSGRGDRVPSPQEQARCGQWLDAELAIIRPKLVIPVGKLAILRFLPNVPLDELIGREHSIQTAGGSVNVIPLPHPSGASSWIYQGDHPKLLNRAIRLLGQRLRDAGITKEQVQESATTAGNGPAKSRSVA
ncbi:MAG: uracil-DNA glycosylase family protein [Gemmatimonadaceae bacterium]